MCLVMLLYYVNFGVINMDLVGLFYEHVVDSPCILTVQVGILFLYFSIFHTSFGVFCYQLVVVLCPF